MTNAFMGEIKALPYTFAPKDWTWCNGQLLQISQLSALFSVLGTAFGGDGRIDFGVPDLQGRTPIHQGRGPGLTQRYIGEMSGNPSVALSLEQIPSHTHTANATTRDAPDSDTPAANRLCHKLYLKDSDTTIKTYTEGTDNLVPMSEHAVSTEGHSADHENRQPFLGVNFCLCLDGLYPSRS